jgi:hypothetical protein
MLKIRGDASMTMGIGTMPVTDSTGVGQNISSDMTMAMELLKPYRRIR